MDLEEIGKRAKEKLDAKNAAREKGLPLSRQTIRVCANAIRAVHRKESDKAQALMDEARALLDEATSAMAEHPDIMTAGFFHDAAKEYAEARITYALVFEEDLPNEEEVEVETAAYLNGMGEAVGEMRRHILDLMRHGEIDRSERLLEAMDDIYYLLMSMDYPDAMTGGLRRTSDAARGIIERTRGDLSTTIIQHGLRKALEDTANG